MMDRTMPGNRSDDTRLPLFALPDVVHFPRTELRLQVAEPRDRRLLRDVVQGSDDDSRRIGMVVVKPGAQTDLFGRPEIFPGGTAARVMDVDFYPDGRATVLLHGEFRFRLEHELSDAPYRQAVVLPVQEPWFDEQDAGIVVVRGAIEELLHSLSAELGETFPLDGDEIEEICSGGPFEEVVNRIASGIDVPLLRKLELLTQSLPERGLSILSILRSRQQVIDQLRPYRHLADGSENN
jgi:uncharacterized protein